jgi:hypothetical protein
LLRERLLGEHRGQAVRSFLALGRAEEDVFLDLVQFVEQLLASVAI